MSWSRVIRLPCNIKCFFMDKNGPVIVIEDDMEDQELLTEIFKKLDYSNEVVFFSDGNKALDYLNKTEIHPFLILSDINMPKMSGFERRKKIFENKALERKCFPYLFFTTGPNQK